MISPSEENISNIDLVTESNTVSNNSNSENDDLSINQKTRQRNIGNIDLVPESNTVSDDSNSENDSVSINQDISFEEIKHISNSEKCLATGEQTIESQDSFDDFNTPTPISRPIVSRLSNTVSLDQTQDFRHVVTSTPLPDTTNIRLENNRSSFTERLSQVHNF